MYSRLKDVGGSMKCRLCGCTSMVTVSFASNFELFGMIQRCFPTLNIQQDDNFPKSICKSCLKRLKDFSSYVDKVLETQSQLQNKFRSNKSFVPGDQRPNLKIKQEPLAVRVKQEVAEGLESFLSEELEEGGENAMDEEAAAIGNSFDNEHKSFCDFPMLNSQDIINNCDIMEIINLDDPFIDIPDDEANSLGADGEEFELDKQATPMRSSVHDVLQAHLLIEEHNYANSGAEDLKQEWPLKSYKTEKIEDDVRRIDDLAIVQQVEEFVAFGHGNLHSVLQNCSSKPIVTSVSALNPSTPNRNPNKPNIVVLNESIVTSSSAFQLLACNVCQLKFFSVDSLNQHHKNAHSMGQHHTELPMVCVPTENLDKPQQILTNCKIEEGYESLTNSYWVTSQPHQASTTLRSDYSTNDDESMLEKAKTSENKLDTYNSEEFCHVPAENDVDMNDLNGLYMPHPHRNNAKAVILEMHQSFQNESHNNPTYDNSTQFQPTNSISPEVCCINKDLNSQSHSQNHNKSGNFEKPQNFNSAESFANTKPTSGTSSRNSKVNILHQIAVHSEFTTPSNNFLKSGMFNTKQLYSNWEKMLIDNEIMSKLSKTWPETPNKTDVNMENKCHQKPDQNSVAETWINQDIMPKSIHNMDSTAMIKTDHQTESKSLESIENVQQRMENYVELSETHREQFPMTKSMQHDIVSTTDHQRSSKSLPSIDGFQQTTENSNPYENHTEIAAVSIQNMNTKTDDQLVSKAVQSLEICENKSQTNVSKSIHDNQLDQSETRTNWIPIDYQQKHAKAFNTHQVAQDFVETDLRNYGSEVTEPESMQNKATKLYQIPTNTNEFHIGRDLKPSLENCEGPAEQAREPKTMKQKPNHSDQKISYSTKFNQQFSDFQRTNDHSKDYEESDAPRIMHQNINSPSTMAFGKSMYDVNVDNSDLKTDNLRETAARKQSLDFNVPKGMPELLGCKLNTKSNHPNEINPKSQQNFEECQQRRHSYIDTDTRKHTESMSPQHGCKTIEKFNNTLKSPMYDVQNVTISQQRWETGLRKEALEVDAAKGIQNTGNNHKMASPEKCKQPKIYNHNDRNFCEQNSNNMPNSMPQKLGVNMPKNVHHFNMNTKPLNKLNDNLETNPKSYQNSEQQRRKICEVKEQMNLSNDDKQHRRKISGEVKEQLNLCKTPKTIHHKNVLVDRKLGKEYSHSIVNPHSRLDPNLLNKFNKTHTKPNNLEHTAMKSLFKVPHNLPNWKPNKITDQMAINFKRPRLMLPTCPAKMSSKPQHAQITKDKPITTSNLKHLVKSQSNLKPSVNNSKPIHRINNITENYLQLCHRYRMLQEKCARLKQSCQGSQLPAKKLLKCSMCPQLQFGNIFKLLQHKQNTASHKLQKIKRFSANCSGCERHFCTKLALRQHMRYICQTLSLRWIKQTQIQTFKCRICCQITFTHWRLYRKHEIDCRRRSKRKLIKKVTINTKPTADIRNDTSPNPLECPICHKVFPQLRNLKQHAVTHSEERSHKCYLCLRVFKRRNGLLQHVRGFHMQLKPFECPVCKHAYALKCDMLRCRHSQLMVRSAIDK